MLPRPLSVAHPVPALAGWAARARHQLHNTCVNPHFNGVATENCPMYRNDQKVRFARGMLHTITSDMPRRIEPAVRYGIIRLTNRTYYFEFRNGSRLIPPALQENIRNLFRENGWTTAVQFDGYVEDYDW